MTAIAALFAATLVARKVAPQRGSNASSRRETSAAKHRKLELGQVVSVGMSRTYLDALSGQPLNPQGLAALKGFVDHAWADPKQAHHEGRTAAQILQAARETVAKVLEIPASNVSFHPISSLARLALSGAVAAANGHAHTGVQAITSPIERAVVLQDLDDLLPAGCVSKVGVSRLGVANFSSILDAIAPTGPAAAIVVLQVANTEVGTLQDLEQVIAYAQTIGVPVVTDATGSLGLTPIPTGWSVLFAEAATWGGPAGVGVLAVAKTDHWLSPNTSSNQAGTTLTDTVDVLAAAVSAASLDAVARAQPTLSRRLTELTARIRHELGQTVNDVDVLGDPNRRLPHIVTFSLLYADGERLADEFDRHGIAIGSGSACASRAGLPSHVLAAIGALTHGNVRVSLPIDATEDCISNFLRVLPTVAAVVRDDADEGFEATRNG